MQASKSIGHRAALVKVILKYCRRAKPATRKEVIKYLVRRREFPYIDVVSTVDEMYKRHMLPGVLY